MRIRREVLAAVFVSAMLWATMARAAIVTPSSLDPGDVFRLVFVTNYTHDATSDDVVDYDAFVHFSALVAGITTYYDQNVNWYALISTPTVDAIDRLPGSTIPIYELDGTLVASGSLLWSGQFLLSEINTTEYGTTLTTQVWTGTARDGVAVPTLQLGSAGGNTALGLTTENLQLPGLWTYAGHDASSGQRSLYAFSSLLVVPRVTPPDPDPDPDPPTSVPEPGTLALFGLCGAGLAMRARRRPTSQ